MKFVKWCSTMDGKNREDQSQHASQVLHVWKEASKENSGELLWETLLDASAMNDALERLRETPMKTGHLRKPTTMRSYIGSTIEFLSYLQFKAKPDNISHSRFLLILAALRRWRRSLRGDVLKRTMQVSIRDYSKFP